MISDLEFEKLFFKVKEELQKLNIPISDKIIYPFAYNNSLNTLGYCEKVEHTRDGESFNLTFSIYVFHFPERIIKDIISHELIHTCENCFNHGKLFKHYASLLSEFGYNISTTLNREEIIEYLPDNIKEKFKVKVNYKIRCKKCGNIVGRNRMSSVIKYPERYICPNCGGKFELFNE